MGFLITWTMIVCTYSYKVKELEYEQPLYAASAPVQPETSKKRSWW